MKALPVHRLVSWQGRFHSTSIFKDAHSSATIKSFDSCMTFLSEPVEFARHLMRIVEDFLRQLREHSVAKALSLAHRLAAMVEDMLGSADHAPMRWMEVWLEQVFRALQITPATAPSEQHSNKRPTSVS